MAKRRGNNEGSIFKRSDGRWCAQIRNGYKENGKPKYVYYYGKTRTEVADWLRVALNEIHEKTYVEKNNITFGEWLDKWLFQYKVNELRDNTFSNYEQHIRVHIKPGLGDILLQELDTDILQDFYNKKIKSKLSFATIRRMHDIINNALELAISLKLIKHNPNKATIIPQVEKKDVRALNLDEQKKFIEGIKNEYYGAAFLLDLFTGMRRGELLALTWDDIDFENELIRVDKSLCRVRMIDKDSREKTTKLKVDKPKTKKGIRDIPINSDIIALLKEHKQKQEKYLNEKGIKSDIVFCSKTGNYIEPRNLNRAFSRIVNKLGLDGVSVHSLRHTFATNGLELGVSITNLQDILGHTKAQTLLDNYVHPITKKESAMKFGMLYKALLEKKNESDR